MATVQAAATITCPHYPPAGQLGPEFICRGCGSLVVNPAHQLNQTQGIVGNVALSSPSTAQTAKRLHS